MINKKFASLMLAGALITTMGTTAFAATTPYCTVNNCTLTGNHLHNGTTYAAHTADDGHTNHANCGVSGCTQTGDHASHNGNHNGGGHGSRKSGGHHG